MRKKYMIDAIRPSVTVVVQDIRSPPLLSHASPPFLVRSFRRFNKLIASPPCPFHQQGVVGM